MLEIIGAGASGQATKDWPVVWKESPEARKVKVDLGASVPRNLFLMVALHRLIKGLTNRENMPCRSLLSCGGSLAVYFSSTGVTLPISGQSSC
jgi:hypothetical protein